MPRLRWLATARLIVLAGALVLTLVVAVIGGPRLSPALALAPLVITLVALAILSLAILAYLHPGRAGGKSQEPSPGTRQRLTALQVFADIVGLTLVIHFAGGAENPFYPLYAFPVIVAAVLLGRSAALGAAGLASVLYAGLVISEWRGVLPHHHVLPASLGLAETGVFVLAQCVAVGVTVFLAAEGTSALVGMLHARTRDLEENQARAEERAAEMRSLNEQLQAANHGVAAQPRAPGCGLRGAADRIRPASKPVEPHERAERATAGGQRRVQGTARGAGRRSTHAARGAGSARDAEYVT